MTLFELSLVALVGIASGTINTIAGGGSLLTLPALIFLGLDPNLANGTNRFGVVLQSASASWSFHREGTLSFSAVRPILLPICLGAGFGAWISTQLHAEDFKTIIAVAMVLMLPVTLYKPHQKLSTPSEDPHQQPPQPPPRSPALRALIFFAIGLYGGFLQAGVGVFLLSALTLFERLELVQANAVKSLLVLIFSTISLALFIIHGLVSWPTACALAFGSVLGGWLGSKLTLSFGPQLIRAVLVVTVLASSTKLFGLW